jgi:hypothetical protein
MFLLMSALLGCVDDLPNPIIVEKTVVEQTYIDECECDTNDGCIADAATPDDSADTAVSTELELQFDPDECRNRLENHVCNMNLMDQHGNRVDLYDYYGSVILLDFSAMWCYPCQQAAYDHNDMVNDFAGQDFVYITVLLENFQRQTPTQDDLISWADQFEIESPILQGRTTLYGQDEKEQWAFGGYPAFVIIDRDMVWHNSLPGFNGTTLRNMVTDALAQ